jgi:hydrogenase maturation protease
MRQLLIAGIGNVLLQDDGIGPSVATTLESRYQFEEGVEVADLGTPGLDFAGYFNDRDCVILVDSVKSGERPGTIHLYRMAEILRTPVTQRMGPHAPALMENLLSMNVLGTAPAELLLVGVAGECFELGCNLTKEVGGAVEAAIAEVLREVTRLGFRFEEKSGGAKPEIWWTKEPA